MFSPIKPVALPFPIQSVYANPADLSDTTL
jgi:hypothetical protein